MERRLFIVSLPPSAVRGCCITNKELRGVDDQAQKKYLQQRQQQGKHKVGESTKKNLIDPFRQEIENNNNSLNGIDFEKSVKKLESAQEVIYIDRQLSNGSKTIKTPQSRLDQINRELEEINGRKS